MSSIRTQFTHKSIMLGICFLGMLLNSQFEAWSSSDAKTDQAESPSISIEAEAEQSEQDDSLEAKKEEAEVSMACFG